MAYLTIILRVLLLALISMNLFATYKVVRSYMYERHQKCAQVAVIWLIPILGGVLAMYLASGKDEKRSEAVLTEIDGLDHINTFLDTPSAD